MTLPRLVALSGRDRAPTKVDPPASAEEGALRITVRACRPARLFRFLPAASWTILAVDVELHNGGDAPLPLPHGESVLLVDGVGYAYRDQRRRLGAGTLAPGERRGVRYLFRVPARSLIGRLQVRDEDGRAVAGTGFMDLKVQAGRP